MAKFQFNPNDMVDTKPVNKAGMTLSVIPTEHITAIMPNQTGEKSLSVDIGAVRETSHGQLIWSGQDQAFLLGKVDQIKGAHLADISDGWVFFSLTGKSAEDVMARLCPIDLRRSKLGAGRSFRTQLGHLQSLVVTTEKGYEIGVMSSFAITARHELIETMKSVAALKKA